MERSALISTRREIDGIDAFRGLAAMFVFLFHFWGFVLNGREVLVGGANFSPFFQAGYRGVDIFFVLSGFLLFTSLWYSKATLKEFYIRRIKRIIPIYYFSLFILLILNSPAFFTTREGFFDIGKHLLFLHAFWPDSFQSINPVAWTLSHEMLFYAILPLLFWLGSRRWWRIFLVGLGMIGASWAYRNYLFNNFYSGWSDQQRFFFTEQLFGKLDQFAIGIIGSFCFIKMAEIRNFHWVGRLLSFVIFAGASAFFYFLLGMSAEIGAGMRDIEWMQTGFGTLTAFAFGIGLLAFLHTFRWIRALISNRVFGFIGIISYSIYLWHYTVLEKIAPLQLTAVPKFFLGLSLTIFFSAATYFLIELPFLKKVNRKGPFAEGSVPEGGTERADSSELRQMPIAVHLPHTLEKERSFRSGISKLKTPSKSKLPVSGKYL
ncbi:acyltransferase [Candidatus Peregrinibacteria bacterium]|nr:acyltransferase [Candidatus Peregrinibacteria bacterium]